MTHDDPRDPLDGIDLHAWQPPAPPSGLADAVLARMREPAGAPAHELAERGARRRWIGIAAAAVAVASVVAIVRWGTTEVPSSGRGELVASRAAHLALGPSSAELDRGAEVRWARDRRRIVVEQPRGAATWRVDRGDTLRIDAGAAVASIEATGASLRVEVHVNKIDAKVVGASGVAAAAVALVTVVVYEGRVQVTSAGETVTVAPGSAIEIVPQQAPRELRTVASEAPREAADDAGCDEVACVVSGYEGACCERYLPPEIEVRRSLAAISPALAACDLGPGRDPLEATLQVAADGSVHDVVVAPASDERSACYVGALRTARFVAKGSARELRHVIEPLPVPRSAPAAASASTAKAPSCNAPALEARGKELFEAGKYAAAVTAFERAIVCDDDPVTRQRALIAACNAKLLPRARVHYAALSPVRRTQVLPVCVRNGIAESQLACDAAAPFDRGAQAHAKGDNAGALAWFEQSLACKEEPKVRQRALLSACNARNLARARHHYARLTQVQRDQALVSCVRNGISEETLRSR
ncbi:MAG: hypothetical protein ACTHU0_00345 [Kofleriaceae bacterium]